MSCHGPGEGDVATLGRTTEVALLGSPNTGKSSLFNRLTGLSAATGNYPGVTVTRSRGTARTSSGSVTVTDLPGTYSLEPASPDEDVVLDHLTGRLESETAPDALLVVMDSTTLYRSLALCAEALALGRPTAVVLTMVDELRARGGDLDVTGLSRALGVPVVETVAHRGRGLEDVRELLGEAASWPVALIAPPHDDAAQLSGWIRSVLDSARYRSPRSSVATSRIDAVLLHPVWGALVFLAVMFCFFQVIFTVAAPIQDAIQAVFDHWGEVAANTLGSGFLADFVGTALIGGVGGVLVFLPQILLLYLMISVLESVGYMSRAAFLMDRIMARSGLDGRAFVAMLSSTACAVPGIMATRTMPSSRDRIATIMSAPLMTCSARLPVYLLLISLLVPAEARLGPFSMQGAALFGMYLLGGLASLVVARVFKATLLRHGALPFYLEMPPYRLPTPRGILRAVWTPVWMFLRKVGTIILVVTAVLWVLINFPARDAETAHMDEAQAQSYVMENSFAGAAGKAVEPVFEPLGFDWRVDIGLIASFAAREVFVSTMGQVAAAEDPEDPGAALQQLTYTHGPHQGEPMFTPPTIVALMIFFAFAMQCVSTLATMRRETNSWKWPAIAVAYMFVLAYGAAWIGHEITAAVTR
ncbi:ferrous iron transporter B [Kocuria tytonicola]|uniref:Ferrous iron transporter B n=1 Tax=Kocuria tytonicola TaxID=2055946 RepID=A0A3L9LAE7_9MICC|nr:ferrous iron transporter B [Kocuria tytonicola]RLY95134.1 ferrous iron transporter B [Kocuria tytonicola]